MCWKQRLKMERKERIVFFLMLFITAVFIWSPLVEHLLCTEPEPTLSMMLLQRIGLLTKNDVCPTVCGRLLAVVKNLILVIAGGLVGYIHRSGYKESQVVTVVVREEEEDEVYARKLRHLRSVMEEVHFPEDFVHESLLQKRSIF